MIQRNDLSACETQLLSPHVKSIPEDCQIRFINAKIETWNYIDNNEWLYVLQKPTSLTLLCGKERIEEIILHHSGTLKLSENCKGYTDTYLLETSDKKSKNVSHFVPVLNILLDDCCLTNLNLKEEDPIQLKPVHLTNVDLTELKYADNKLHEFDEILTNQMKKPFLSSHLSWYSIMFSVIGALIFLIVLLNCCKWCGCYNFFRKLCCFTRSPRNGEVIPPLIRNFVNCTFDSDLRREYHNQTRDVVLYDVKEENVELQSITPITKNRLDNSPYHFRPVGSRRSTTPM